MSVASTESPSGPSKKVLDFCGRRVIGRNCLSAEVHFYRETGITRQLSKSQALKVYSLKTPGIEGSGNGARNFLIEGEWRGSRGPKFLPRAARQPAALPDHIPGPGTACLCAPSPLGALGGPACPRRRAGAQIICQQRGNTVLQNPSRRLAGLILADATANCPHRIAGSQYELAAAGAAGRHRDLVRVSDLHDLGHLLRGPGLYDYVGCAVEDGGVESVCVEDGGLYDYNRPL